jgi:hypothetical protein
MLYGERTGANTNISSALVHKVPGKSIPDDISICVELASMRVSGEVECKNIQKRTWRCMYCFTSKTPTHRDVIATPIMIAASGYQTQCLWYSGYADLL